MELERRERGYQCRSLLILSEAYVGVIIQCMSREPRGRVWREKVWQKPVPNFLKVNCDASFHKDTGEGG